MKTTSALTIPLLLIAGTFGACGTPAPERPYRQAGAPDNPGAPGAADLRAFCDRSASKLALKISSIPTIKNAPQRVVIYLGAIEKQGTTPVSDYEYARRRLQDQLVNADVVQQVAMLIEQPEINDEQIQRLRTKDSSAAPPRFPAEITYVLNGYFGELSRGQGYFLQMKLVHLATGQIVFSERYDSQDERPVR